MDTEILVWITFLQIQKFSDFMQFYMMQLDLGILLLISDLVIVMFYLDFQVLVFLVT